MGVNKIKGMYTCDVCGRDFPLIAEERHTVRGTERSGIATAISFEEADRYDAFDCPHCGCQNVVNLRLREERGCREGERAGGEGVSDGE